MATTAPSRHRADWSIPIQLVCLLGLGLGGRSASAGILIGTQTSAPASMNLTTEGTLDWAHWGLNEARLSDGSAPAYVDTSVDDVGVGSGLDRFGR